jgi:hypothetical protein
MLTTSHLIYFKKQGSIAPNLRGMFSKQKSLTEEPEVVPPTRNKSSHNLRSKFSRQKSAEVEDQFEPPPFLVKQASEEEAIQAPPAPRRDTKPPSAPKISSSE